MRNIKKLFERVITFFSKIPLKTYVTIILEAIGLFANLIALTSFFNAKNTPETSPNFYINNQEFLAWSSIAVVYTLGIIIARMKRHWRKTYNKKIDNRTDTFSRVFFRDGDSFEIFKRDFSFTLVISFPITFLYVRAIQASATEGTASPWISLVVTTVICLPISLLGIVISTIFENALALYSGD